MDFFVLLLEFWVWNTSEQEKEKKKEYRQRKRNTVPSSYDWSINITVDPKQKSTKKILHNKKCYMNKRETKTKWNENQSKTISEIERKPTSSRSTRLCKLTHETSCCQRRFFLLSVHRYCLVVLLLLLLLWSEVLSVAFSFRRENDDDLLCCLCSLKSIGAAVSCVNI